MNERLQSIIAILDRSTQSNCSFEEWKELCRVTAAIIKSQMPTNETYLKECFLCDVTAFSLFDDESDI